MIEKVPKEELNALFHEIYKKGDEPDLVITEQNLNDALVNFYGYKFLKLFNRYLSQKFSIPIFIKNFKVDKYQGELSKSYIGYSIEDKYRVYFDIDYPENFDIVSFDTLLEIVKGLSEEFINHLRLKSSYIGSSYTYFFTEEVLIYSYNLYVEDNPLVLKVYIEKEFLDAGLISHWILSNPVSEEKRRIEKLKSRISVYADIESEPIKIDISQNRIKLPNNLKFSIKNVQPK